MNDNEPIIVPRSKEGTIFEVITGILIIVLWVLTWWLYRHAPEQVPIHFGLNLSPDSMGSRSSLIVMAVLGTVFSLGMLWSAYHPETVNLPFKINPSAQHDYNVRMVRIKSVRLPIKISLPKQYVYVVRMVRLLAVEMVFLFIAVVLMMGTTHVGYYPMVLFFFALVLICITTIYYSIKVYKIK